MVDVYADVVTNCIFRFANAIVLIEHSGIAVLTLLSAVFEPLGGILRGGLEIQPNFVAGLDWVLQQERASSGTSLAGLIYKFVRCGLFHEGFIKPGICLKDSGEAIAERDGVIIVDPVRLLRETEKQFRSFVARLNTDESLRRSFDTYWRLRDENHQSQLRTYWPTAAVQPPSFTGTATFSPSPGATLLAEPDGLTEGEEDQQPSA